MAIVNTSKNTYKAPPKPVAKPAPKPVAKPAPKPVAKPAPKYVPSKLPVIPKAPASKMATVYKGQHKPPPAPPPKAPPGKMATIYKDMHKPVPKPVVKPTPSKAAPKGKMAEIYKDMHKPITTVKPAPPKVTAKPAPIGTKPKITAKPAPLGTKPKVTAKPLPTVKLPPKAAPPKTTAPPKAAPPKTTAPPKAAPPKTTAPPVIAPPKVVAPPPPKVRDANGTVGPTDNGHANWNSNQSIPDYGAMQPDMIKNIEEGYLNGGRQYDPNTDPAYQAQLLLAKKQADAMGLSTMEDMNERGILNSTITSDRVGQIKQGASDAVIGNIPGMQANFNDQQARNQAGYSDLLRTVMGGGQFQQEFAEGNRRFDKSYQLDEAEVTGSYTPAEAIYTRGAVIPSGTQTLKAQGQYADQALAKDKLAFDKDAFGRELQYKKDTFGQELQYKKDTFNREMNFQETDSAIKNHLASRGLDLEEIKVGTDQFVAESDATYKLRTEKSGMSEQEASANTNKAIGTILGATSLEEGFAFLESQTNAWGDSGVDFRSVINALESKFPGAKKALTEDFDSEYGGGTP